MTAEQLLEKRFVALENSDFAAVYDSYHPEAPFLQQFADQTAYVDFAQQQLSAIIVDSWQSLRQRKIDGNQQEHLLVMKLTVDGINQYFYELALLIDTADGWRYHSAQKLGVEDYPGPPEQVQFDHFDQAPQQIRY